MCIAAHSSSQIVVDAAKQRLPDQTAKEGVHLLMSVHLPPVLGVRTRQQSFEEITAVDHAHHRVCWCAAFLGPRWLLATERWQALSEVIEGGERKTRYESKIAHRGVMAYILRYLLGGTMQGAFNDTAMALKRRAESVL
jgi:hypothetical protein